MNIKGHFIATCESQSVPALTKKPDLLWLGFLLPILLSILLLFSASTMAAQTASQKKVDQLKTDIKQLESQLQGFEKEEGHLSGQLRTIEKEAAGIHQQLTATKTRITSSQTRLTNLNREQQRLDEDKRIQQEALAGQLDSAYRMGQQDQIKVLLNQQDPNLVSRMMRYYEYISESRVQAIQAYQVTLTELQRVKADIEQTHQQLAQQEQQLQSKSEQLTQSRRQREELLVALKEKIASTDVRLKADRERLELLAKRLQQTLDKNDLNWQSTEFRQLKGKLTWPTAGRVVSNYGATSRQGISNEGMVIGAPAGKNVRAVHHGRVVFSDWLRGYGLLIIIDHGSGYMSLYGHNQALNKTVGDWVNAKEVIATVGDTGGNQQTGVYFAIRYKGKPHNPKSWLAKSSG